MRWKCTFVHLDDIVRFSHTSKAYIEHTRLVFLLLENTVVTLKLKKYALLTARQVISVPSLLSETLKKQTTQHNANGKL